MAGKRYVKEEWEWGGENMPRGLLLFFFFTTTPIIPQNCSKIVAPETGLVLLSFPLREMGKSSPTKVQFLPVFYWETYI